MSLCTSLAPNRQTNKLRKTPGQFTVYSLQGGGLKEGAVPI
jgi:hypothetical protein